VILSLLQEEGLSDYINASFIRVRLMVGRRGRLELARVGSGI
jgi:hypothetical protein